jgi:hypothetical protein
VLRLDKGKGKATEMDLTASPPSFSPPLPPTLTVTTSEPESDQAAENQKVLLASLPFTHPQISSLLTRAKAEMPLRPVKFPILGEYKECFSGEDFVGWLLENVPEFQRDLDIVLVAARDLTEREDLLRRLGEFGNHFDHADDVFYQFRPKVPCYIPSCVYLMTFKFSGFYAWSASLSPTQVRVPSTRLTLAAYCSGTGKVLRYTRGYRQQGVGLECRTFGAGGKPQLPKPTTAKPPGLWINTG